MLHFEYLSGFNEMFNAFSGREVMKIRSNLSRKRFFVLAVSAFMVIPWFLPGASCTGEKTTVYPDVTVSGLVVDTDGAPMPGVGIALGNTRWFYTSTTTDGTFNFTVDGRDASSTLKISGATVRTRQLSVPVGADGYDAGTIVVMASDTILFSTAVNFSVNWTGDIWLVHADGSGLTLLIDDPDDGFIHPRWEYRGTKVAYLDQTDDAVMVCAWNGTGNTLLESLPSAYEGCRMIHFDWGYSGLLMSLMGSSDSIYLDSALSSSNDKNWNGRWADFSPVLSTAAIGPATVDGNIILYQGTDDSLAQGIIWSSHPCVDEPQGSCPSNHIAGTSASDQMPRISGRVNTGAGEKQYRVVYRDSSQDLMYSMMTIDDYTIAFSTPVKIFDAINVYHYAWSFDCESIIATTGTALSPDGRIIRIPFTGSLTAWYDTVYDPSENGNRKAWTVEWF